MGSGGDKGKSNLFGGMKIKGNTGTNTSKDQKSTAVQSQTSLVINSKKESISEHSLESSSSQNESFSKKPERRSSTYTTDEKAQQQQFSRKVDSEEKPPKPQAKSSEKNEVPMKDMASPEISVDKVEKPCSPEQALQKPQQKAEKAKNPMLSNMKRTVPKEDKKPETQKPSHDTKKKQQKKPERSDKEAILQELNKSHLQHIALIQKQKQSKDKLIACINELTTFRDDLTTYTSKQCAAVEKEEYDQAEKLQSKIETVSAKIIEREEEMEHNQESCYENQYEELALLKSAFNDSKRLVRKIKLVELQLLEEASTLTTVEGQLIEEEKNKNEHEKKKINRIEVDLKHQTGQLEEFIQKYNEDKDSRINPLKEERQSLNSSKNELQEEIRELEAKLKSKKATLQETQSALKEINGEMSQVEESFRQEGAKLQQRKGKLSHMESEKHDLQSKLKEMDRHVQASISKMETQVSLLNGQAESLAKVAKSIEAGGGSIEDILEDRKAKLDSYIHSSQALQSFMLKHKGAKEKIKELQFSKSNILAEVTKHEDRKKEVKNKIPVLESQQKAMASAKNFKAAGLKKTEIKQAMEQLECLNKKIERNFIEEKDIDEAVNNIETEQEQFIQQENEIKKNLAINQYKFQVEKISGIREEKDWVIVSKVANKQKFVQLLDSQIESIQEILDYIGEEYQLSREQSPSKKSIPVEEDPPVKEEETPQPQTVEKEEKQTDEKQVELKDEKVAEIEEEKTEEVPPQEEVAQYSKAEGKEEDNAGEDDGYVPLQLD